MPLKFGLILALCLWVAVACGERARYDNYRVYKVVASSETELATLKSLDGASDSIRFLDGVHLVDRDVHVVVAPHKVPDFLEIMGTNEIAYELVERNLQSALETDDAEVAPRAAAYGWDQYYTLDATYNWLTSLAKEYPGIVTAVDGGSTYQRRKILGVKISHGQTQKPIIFIEGGIHAREWISPATATYIINELLTSKDPAVVAIAKKFEWHIFPHTNPDGYVYTHTTDRMWRKTRTPYGQCFGADPNRNWGWHWNEVGSSSNPCSDTYAGSKGFSEMETRTLSEYLLRIKKYLALYISFHSYSQYLLYPYGYTNDKPKNVEDYKKIFAATTSAISKSYGTKYTGGSIYTAIYPASGSTVDYAYDVLDAKLSFCFELRPSSSNGGIGFRLPASQIKPTGKETLEGVVAMIGESERLGYLK